MITPRKSPDREAAFTKFVVPEAALLLRVANRLTPQRQDAEDLVQDTLVRAYRAIDRFDGRHPRAWLLTILRNCAMNKSRRTRPLLVDDFDLLSQHDIRTGRTRSVEDQVMDQILDDDLAECLEALSSRDRVVVQLVDEAGLRYAEAATTLGIPIGTVMSRLHRARTALRTCLGRSTAAVRLQP